MNEAEAVVLRLCGVLLGNPDKPGDRGLLSLVIDGQQHIPLCPFGQWLTPGGPRPEGDPCSSRCAEARAALDDAGRWLKSVERPEQLTLLEPAS